MKTTTSDALTGGEPDLSHLFNPVVWWTDLGMRTTEAMVEQTQDLTEGADRLTRAVAGAEPAAPADPLGGIQNLQRRVWDMMAHNWLEWAAAVAQLMSAAAGVRPAGEPAMERQPRRKAPARARRTRHAA